MTVEIVCRIGPGEPSGLVLALPREALRSASRGVLAACEVADDSADGRFPAGSVLICEPWSGPVSRHSLAIVVPHQGAAHTGPFRIAEAAAASAATGMVRWWSAALATGRDGPLPTEGGEHWTPILRPIAALVPIFSGT